MSKHTFLAALKERGAVLFCPGGQAEMVHAWKAFLPAESRELVLHTRHKGFCRYVVEYFFIYIYIIIIIFKSINFIFIFYLLVLRTQCLLHWLQLLLLWHEPLCWCGDLVETSSCR